MTALEELEFWAIVHNSRGGRGDGQKLERLVRSLIKLPLDEIIGFYVKFDEFRQRANTRELWGASIILNSGVCQICDFCFYDFRNWLISRGRDVYFSALTDPDSLAKERIRPNDKGLVISRSESIGLAAAYAVRAATNGKDAIYDLLRERGIEVTNDELGRSSWPDFSITELCESYPKLWKKFEKCYERYKELGQKLMRFQVRDAVVPGVGHLVVGGKLFHKSHGVGVITLLEEVPGARAGQGYVTALVRFFEGETHPMVFDNPKLFSLIDD